MRSMLFVAILATSAYAQAPGEVVPTVGGVMMNRWAISAGLGMESATPKGDNATSVGFGVLELSGRLRLRADIELALTLDGGGSSAGQAASTGGIYADFRYRFLAEHAWNVIALAGVGLASIGPKVETGADNKARGSLRIGGGVERRFDHFALELDLRLFAIAENKDFMTASQLIDTSYELARDGVSGAELTLGGTYYF